MTTEEIIESLNDRFGEDELLFANGFEDALLGTVVGACRQPVLCYDYDKCIEILMRDGMDEETAIECFEFNTIDANVGPRTPLYLHNMRTQPPE
jgi:hypothetical protein